MNEISTNLKLKIKENTIILIDATHANGLENVLLHNVPNNVVLSVFSEVIVKTIEYDTRLVYQHVGNKVTTMIGTSISNPPTHIRQALKGNSSAGKQLIDITNNLQNNGVYPCTIVQPGVKPSINSFIWKQIFSFLVFGVLSLIYGNLNQDLGKFSVVKNLFKDLIELAANDCEGELPRKEDTQKVDMIFRQILDQHNQLHSRYKVESSNKSIESTGSETLEIPLCIYNFTGNFIHQIQLCFDQCLNQSIKLKISTPYVECINTFYQEIKEVQSQKVFDWTTKASFEAPIPVPISAPRRSLPINSSFNNSDTSLFNSTQNGSNTPLTPMSNTVPPGYTFYPEQNVMLPNGINSDVLRNPPIYPTKQMEQYANCAKKAEHPRFKDLPETEVNGKKVYFKQIKTLAYPSTKGSTAPEVLVQAQKHLYQYSNLNGIFETINNRYGTSDSLEVFKISSGFKPDADDEDEDIVLMKGNYQNGINSDADAGNSKSRNNNSSSEDDDDEDEVMADADESINL